MKRYLVGLVALALLVAAAPAASAAPSDGNGKKLGFAETFGPFPLGCGDVELTIDFVGQFMPKEHGKNDEVATFNIELVYANGAGESWLFRDRGADRIYEEDGIWYQAITGRSGLGNIGKLVISDPFGAPEVVFQKGQAIDPDFEACERLS